MESPSGEPTTAFNLQRFRSEIEGQDSFLSFLKQFYGQKYMASTTSKTSSPTLVFCFLKLYAGKDKSGRWRKG